MASGSFTAVLVCQSRAPGWIRDISQSLTSKILILERYAMAAGSVSFSSVLSN